MGSWDQRQHVDDKLSSRGREAERLKFQPHIIPNARVPRGMGKRTCREGL